MLSGQDTWRTIQQKSENQSLEFQLFPIRSKTVYENSLENIWPDPVQSTLPRLDLPWAAFELEDREEIAESLCTDETAPLETPEEMDKIHLTL